MKSKITMAAMLIIATTLIVIVMTGCCDKNQKRTGSSGFNTHIIFDVL